MNHISATILLLLLVPLSVDAQVLVTEIMYDLRSGSDSGREWIEVFNAGKVSLNVSELRLFENETNHKLTALDAKVLAPGMYAVIAADAVKFKVDWPDFTGPLFDSAFSLSNDGETFSLRKGSQDIGSATFTAAMGGDGTGDSLQRSSEGSVFAAGIPTPGSGIPTGGLQKSSPKELESSAKENAAVLAEVDVVGETEEGEMLAMRAVASGAVTREVTWYWWFAPLLLASVGSAGVLVSRHCRKDEWDIIEEKGEPR